MKKGQHICSACGWRHLELPQRSSSGGASHEICPSCGFESGFTDDDQGHTFEAWRKMWVAGGLQWSSKGHAKPKDWNPMSDIHSLLRRRRPVIPAIRLKRAAALRAEAAAAATETSTGDGANVPVPQAMEAKTA